METKSSRSISLEKRLMVKRVAQLEGEKSDAKRSTQHALFAFSSPWTKIRLVVGWL
jgi:hypothetical protein